MISSPLLSAMKNLVAFNDRSFTIRSPFRAAELGGPTPPLHSRLCFPANLMNLCQVVFLCASPEIVPGHFSLGPSSSFLSPRVVSRAGFPSRVDCSMFTPDQSSPINSFPPRTFFSFSSTCGNSPPTYEDPLLRPLFPAFPPSIDLITAVSIGLIMSQYCCRSPRDPKSSSFFFLNLGSSYRKQRYYNS